MNKHLDNHSRRERSLARFMMRKKLSIEAPCKVNLHLRILGKRGDSYHNLEGVFMALALGDTLSFEVLGNGPACEIITELDGCPEPGAADTNTGIPIGENLVFKALKLFRAETGFDRALRIRLTKRIPIGAGLGGGSSDAAAALLALNALAETAIPISGLGRMALSLGSDVPFFLAAAAGCAAYVGGRGELIEPIDPPPAAEGLWFVLVNPGFQSETAGAYRLLDEDRLETATEIKAGAPPKEELIRALWSAPENWPYGNDFLDLFLRKAEENKRGAYGRLISELKALGASYAGLSGSGSTCFGVFTNKGEAEKAKNHLLPSWKWIQLTAPLARSTIAVLKL